MKPVLASQLLIATTALLLAGCGRDGVKVYQVETNDTTSVPPPPAQAGGMGSMPGMAGNIPIPDNSGLPKLKYTLPDGWKEKPLTQLRLASFEIATNGKSVDVSVIPLSGLAGGDTANVNRWRGQVGLPALNDAESLAAAEKIEAAGQPAELYDIAGTSPGSGDAERIIGVILHKDDTAWFFKMNGDADLAEQQKPAFIAFLKSVSFGAPTAAPAMDMTQLPPSHPPIGDMNLGAQSTDTAAKPTWTIPAGWEEGQLAQFLVARYVIKGEGETSATVNVSQLSGDGGGLTANVNRWRGQLGQPPISDEEVAKLPTIDAAGTKAVVADITGSDPRTGKPAELIGVVLPLDGQSWFYKLMGDAAVVTAQKDAFLKFVESAKYPAGQ